MNVQSACSYATAAPIIAAELFIGSRLAAGVVGLSAKGVSQAVNAIGLENLAGKLENGGNHLISFATRSIDTEVKLTAGLAAVAIAAQGTNALLLKLQPKPEPIWLEKVLDYLYPPTEIYSPMEPSASLIPRMITFPILHSPPVNVIRGLLCKYYGIEDPVIEYPVAFGKGGVLNFIP